MPRNGGWEDGKLVRATKTFLKIFGPLIVTGLAAVVEHHLLGHDDEPDHTTAREQADEPDDKPSIRKLEREVAELKRSLSRKQMDEEEHREARPPPRVREEPAIHFRGRPLPDERPEPSSHQQYHQAPVTQQIQTRPAEAPAQFLEVRDPGYIRPSRRQHSVQRRRRHHRPSSVPNRRSYEDGSSHETIHAGKVAAIAGAAEAAYLHVSDVHGDWIGPKGVRVGTTMAATYAASWSRDRDLRYRKREVVADVGTGLLINRLVHGSSRRLEEDERLARKGRRWSYCY